METNVITNDIMTKTTKTIHTKNGNYINAFSEQKLQKKKS